MKDAPRTLQQAIQYFADFDDCQVFLIELCWADGKMRCPYCGSDHVVFLENAAAGGAMVNMRSRNSRSTCEAAILAQHAKPQFSLKVGTIMEDSPDKK